MVRARQLREAAPTRRSRCPSTGRTGALRAPAGPTPPAIDVEMCIVPIPVQDNSYSTTHHIYRWIACESCVARDTQLSIYLFLCFFLSIYPSIYLSIYRSIDLSISSSIYRCLRPGAQRLAWPAHTELLEHYGDRLVGGGRFVSKSASQYASKQGSLSASKLVSS